jgi:4-methoxybenzoate monooxygenase (O-demethylating)
MSIEGKRMLKSDVAISDFDPFSEEALADPFRFHARLREQGALLWLERYGVWCAARYDDVRKILLDHVNFSSAGGAGLPNYFKQKPWRRPSLLLETDPPLHEHSHRVVMRTMSPGAMKELRESFCHSADELIGRLVERGTFDAVKDIAEVFPFMVFVEALGIENDGDDALLRYAEMVFAGFGPENAFCRSAMSHAPRVLPWIEEKCQRDALRPGSFGAQIYDAADAGEIAMEDAPLLVRSFLSAGLDTTMSALGTMIHCLAEHPQQWELLRNSPALIRQTFDEVVRYDPPVWALFRTAFENTEYAGTKIGKHEKVLLLIGSANRDEYRWTNPDRFEITRKTSGHIGFGTGIHGCVGQMVARLEGEAILAALSHRVKSIELAGDPIRRMSTGLRAFSSVPVSVQATSIQTYI